ncbi:chlorogenic acid esterase precursor [Penicillium longicatenatum]|uniref:chlorogenic acid esterase precursor n=1 Tax=Penicillium longicatenatum TaxID=1561947 RepID=UPI0025497EBA|nr:chlorogenic acid esterase precursor [Penicillium longicatenatum]KAJ5661364.1 chlorogenic acid esterase precursor [Penicillium longicatenatum]
MLARKVCLAAILSALEVFGAPTSSSKTAKDAGLLIQTSSGSIKGFFNSSAPDVCQFLGVPFAEPPVGDLRFARPQEVTSKGKVKAHKLPNSCNPTGNETRLQKIPTDGPRAATLTTITKIISCPVNKEVKNRNLGYLPTYRYQYTRNFSNVSPLPWFGAYHSLELPLLFGTHDEYRSRSTKFEWEVSYAMEALWLSFAEDPTQGPGRVAICDAAANPNKKSYFAWPEFHQGGEDMLLIAKDNEIMQLVSSESIDASC